MISLLTFPKENYDFPFDAVAFYGSKILNLCLHTGAGYPAPKFLIYFEPDWQIFESLKCNRIAFWA